MKALVVTVLLLLSSTLAASPHDPSACCAHAPLAIAFGDIHIHTTSKKKLTRENRRIPWNAQARRSLQSLASLLTKFFGAEWCVCRQDATQAALQKTIDYACGSGADCNSIHENGACYNPNTVPAHCSWAANSYYQNNKAKGATCDFTGTATLTTSDPSSSGCSYPTSASAAGTMTPTTGGTMGGTPGTFTPGTGTGTGTTGTGMGTGTTTGTTGFGGLGPGTNAGMDTAAAAGLLLPRAGLSAAFIALLLSAIVLA